jgi:excisionase family DNA binding protein
LPATSPLPPNKLSALLTTDEVAEVLRCTPLRVRNLVYEGRLPRVKGGARNLYRREDVEDYLKSSC